MIRLGLTFDDVLLEPRKTDVRRSGTNVETRLTKKARLAIPLLGAASDTVSDAKFAIALAELGGLAVLHRNCTVEEQTQMVREVKASGATVGAAVGPLDVERAEALALAGAEIIFMDCAHAHAPGIIKAAKEMKKKTGAQLVIGNIATKEAAKDFAGVADAMKVGIGPGSICTTRIVSGVGVPQLTAILDVASVANKKGIPVIADGGIRYSGDIVKALAAGASSVMLGSIFAGALEAPGELITIEGIQYKKYRGMGSSEALEKRQALDRYSTDKKHGVAEGVSGKVEYRGKLSDIVAELVGGIRSGMSYIGAETIADIRKQARFIQITNAGLKESHTHSLE